MLPLVAYARWWRRSPASSIRRLARSSCLSSILAGFAQALRMVKYAHQQTRASMVILAAAKECIQYHETAGAIPQSTTTGVAFYLS